MGWERRGGSKYYYRKRRVGGRVVSEYVGSDLQAELNAADVERIRREREAYRAEREEARSKEEEIDQAVAEFEMLVKAMTRGYLIAQGYHTHKGQLIDQVIVSWLQLQRTQVNYEQVSQRSISNADADSWERRLTAAHMRYLRACETLARVRKLSRPTPMQVNIGTRQVNVAQTARTADEDPAEQVKSVNVGRPALPAKT